MNKLTLENQWLCVTVLSYGATIASIVDKTLQKELVLGFDDDQKYLSSDKYFGCTVGRGANRISNGHFYLNDQPYQLSINNGPNHLHGGTFGFDKKEFDCKREDNAIICTYFSTHLEEGYPGNVTVRITYTLEGHRVTIRSTCQSDRDTLINLTNHTYFNLDQKKGTIENHLLEINADRVYPVDENGCTLNRPFDVNQTPFDFTKQKSLSECLQSDHPQIMIARGLDHHFKIKGLGLRLATTLIYQGSVLNVYTDKPGVHIYTGNYLNEEDIGHDNIPYIRQSGICFEAQYVPNSINFDTTIAPIVKAGQLQEHLTIFEFENMR
ncbi:MAG: aldose epimerase family protein [Erysipelotrichaceae bacterium]|nr:aldose epimerase family protein [Erysipelotrichaceae bacterium]